MKCTSRLRPLIGLVVLQLIAHDQIARGAITTEEPRPAYQVLDKKPENLMLHYFERVAKDLQSRQHLPATRDEWQRRRAELQNQLRQTLGNFPWQNRPPIKAKITGWIDHGDHVVEKVLYESLPGLYVTALAYVPKAAHGRMPAVLCVNGHWTDAKATELIQRRCMGLARMGALAFCQDVIGTGERQAFNGTPPTTYHGFYRGAAPRITDRTLQGFILFECMRALDYVSSRPDVDPSRIMCTGASGGGMQSMYFAALDERLAGAVPVCYISSYNAHIGATACVCEVPPGILGYTEQWEILALHAPRPLLCIAASKDVSWFQPALMLSTLDKTRGVYRFYNGEEKVTSATVDSGHDYNKPMREQLYRHVAKYLLGRDKSSISEPNDLPVEKPAALSVGLPPNSETMQTLTFSRARELVSQIAKTRDPQQWCEIKGRQQNQLRDDILGGFPDSSPEKPALVRTLSHHGYIVEHWTFKPEPGILMPAMLCLPANAETKKRPAILIVDENGKQAALESGLIDALVSHGSVVLAIDYRGAGETAGTVSAIGYGPSMPEYNLTNYSLYIGRPLAGQRVVDIRAATDYLTNRPEVAANRVAIIGRGRGALSAVLAASFDNRLHCVVADEFLASLVFNEEFVDIGLEYFIPRILTVADMPHLLAHIAPRPLLVLDPVDGRRRAISVENCNQQLESATAVYRLLNASDRIRVSRRKAAKSFQDVIDWLQTNN
jgi:dienelactone hydrolase